MINAVSLEQMLRAIAASDPFLEMTYKTFQFMVFRVEQEWFRRTFQIHWIGTYRDVGLNSLDATV